MDVKNRLQTNLSHRDFSECVKRMINERLLDRRDPGKVRGTRVYYSLSRKAITKEQLGILGIDENTEKRKSLYQLLLFFETFKRRSLMSNRQLHYLLKKIGSSYHELKIIGKGNNPYGFGAYTAFQPIKGIQIIRMDQMSNVKNSQTSHYYTVFPGFSVKEFTEYLKLLRRGKDPRPFSKYSSIPQIPSLFHHYTERETQEAIDSLRNDGIIKPIQGVFTGELRYDIVDNSLKHLIFGVWLVHIIDFHLLTTRLVFEGKPIETDKQYLKIFLGSRATDRFLAFAHDFRKKKKSLDDDKKNIIKKWEKDRALLIQEIKKRHGRLIQENEVIAEIIEGVCSSRVFHMTATH